MGGTTVSASASIYLHRSYDTHAYSRRLLLRSHSTSPRAARTCLLRCLPTPPPRTAHAARQDRHRHAQPVQHRMQTNLLNATAARVQAILVYPLPWVKLDSRTAVGGRVAGRLNGQALGLGLKPHMAFLTIHLTRTAPGAHASTAFLPPTTLPAPQRTAACRADSAAAPRAAHYAYAAVLRLSPLRTTTFGIPSARCLPARVPHFALVLPRTVALPYAPPTTPPPPPPPSCRSATCLLFPSRFTHRTYAVRLLIQKLLSATPHALFISHYYHALPPSPSFATPARDAYLRRTPSAPSFRTVRFHRAFCTA